MLLVLMEDRLDKVCKEYRVVVRGFEPGHTAGMSSEDIQKQRDGLADALYKHIQNS